ncbi:MAG: hypothetical protein A2X18_12970 [Bacteroidetes bacterium GWF2_40_14]|nr:MAG: hypothetical protein A2X18_12970 [Bacteroidetes bacterium GWF2_40_14]
MSYLENTIKINTNNINICYIDEGSKDATTIIFIHGFPFNKLMWNLQLQELKENYRVIAYDIRGYGGSDAGTEDFSIELFVKDLICFMDALRIDKTVLCGLSMGGYIALNAVENYPERFSALILCDTNCIADTSEAKEKRISAIESIRKNGEIEYAETSIKNLFSPEAITTMEYEITALKKEIVNTSGQTLCNTLLALAGRRETCSKLPEIKIPVLIMVGKEDKITPPGAAKSMHEIIKNSLLVIIENAGHISNLENHNEFNNHLKKFALSIKSK